MIADAKNIGPVMGSELTSIGISSLEQLAELGLEESFLSYIASYPHRLNLICLMAMWGAVHNKDWREVDSSSKDSLRSFLNQCKLKIQRNII